MSTPQNPFKFLDAYTQADRDIFFGRAREIKELYHKVFESKILLLYGISGTGKTSLINCGLANKFQESDWLPISIRRGKDINQSLVQEIHKAALSKIRDNTPIVKAVQSLYLDRFKPIYLIFDQFEELFIFGDRQERETFIQTIHELVGSEVQCKCLFSIREEYLAGVTEFENYIPEFLTNRMRVEKMTLHQAKEVIEGPCKVNGIEVEEGFSDALLEKLNPGTNEIELTYLQVFLDRIFRLSGENNRFTLDHIDQAGDVSDLLGSFLEEQIGELKDPDAGLTVLKAFVTMQGTKKQIGEDEISDFARTLGKPVEKEELTNLLQDFVTARLLKDKDEHGQYELRHDSLADKIYEKITLVEKELLEVKDFLDNAYNNYLRRKVYLSHADLKYISPFEDKLFLIKQLDSFIRESKSHIEKSRRRKRNLIAAAAIALIVIFAGFSLWALIERKNAIEQERIAQQKEKEALQATEEAALARREQRRLEELLQGSSGGVYITPIKMNILYRGVNNPVAISASGVTEDRLRVSCTNGNIQRTGLGLYNVTPGKANNCRISIHVEVEGIIKLLAMADFRVLDIENPVARVGDQTGGAISVKYLLEQGGLNAVNNTSVEFDVQFAILEFTVVFQRGGITVSYKSNNQFFTEEQKSLIRTLRKGAYIYFQDIKAIGPDGSTRSLNGLIFEIL